MSLANGILSIPPTVESPPVAAKADLAVRVFGRHFPNPVIPAATMSHLLQNPVIPHLRSNNQTTRTTTVEITHAERNAAKNRRPFRPSHRFKEGSEPCTR